VPVRLGILLTVPVSSGLVVLVIMWASMLHLVVRVFAGARGVSVHRSWVILGLILWSLCSMERAEHVELLTAFFDAACSCKSKGQNKQREGLHPLKGVS